MSVFIYPKRNLYEVLNVTCKSIPLLLCTTNNGFHSANGQYKSIHRIDNATYYSYHLFFKAVSDYNFHHYRFGLNYCTEPPDKLEVPLELFSEQDEKNQFIPRSLRVGNIHHQVLIIHPYIKWGPKKQPHTTPELELEEAISLVKSIENWKVISTKKMALLSFDSNTLFNSGQFEIIKELVNKNELISAVFINLKSLKLEQHLLLEKALNVPIFDRYSIVINIFKKHAISKEAKLQVALAEVPYIRSRVRGINKIESGQIIKNTGIGSNETYLTKRLKTLSFHEQKLKRELERLKKNREVLRAKRKYLHFPIIAVVGYTNAGKTSLIKCLTSEKKMEPEDKLFATLDVTFHAGILPGNLKVLYIDTIGFISDIPTNLLEPFVATLEDAVEADLIIHVQDISHPNHTKQNMHVLDVLRSLKLKDNLMNSIISVGNKCDKITDTKSLDNDIFLISCKKQIGFEELELEIGRALSKNMELKSLRIRVKSGGKEYEWLHREAAVSNYLVDENNEQFIFLDVTISKAKLEQFKHYFIK